MNQAGVRTHIVGNSAVLEVFDGVYKRYSLGC